MSASPPPSDPTHSTTPEPEGAGFLRRIVLLISAPGRLGDHLRERPVWWDTLLLGGLLVAGANLLVPPEVWADFMRAQAMAAGAAAPEGTSTRSGELVRIFSSLAAPLVWALFMLASAGIMTFVFAFLLGDDGRFKQYFAGTAHAALLSGLGGVLVSPLRAARSDPQLTLSVGTFLQGALDGTYVGTFLGLLDLFGLWAWIVMGIVFSRFDRERSAGSGIGLVLAVSGVLLAALAWFQHQALR
jgi:hypothetical protein